MPSSPALQTWLGQRALELDELFHAHGTLVGSPYAGLQVEQACIIAVSGQFQGYCRDVLRLAVTLIVDAAAPPGVAAPAAPPPAAGGGVVGAPIAAPAAPAAV